MELSLPQHAAIAPGRLKKGNKHMHGERWVYQWLLVPMSGWNPLYSESADHWIPIAGEQPREALGIKAFP